MRLAIDGGEPVRNTPFPARRPFGDEELAQVKEALDSQTLFYSSGSKVRQFEKEFAGMYGAEHAVCCTSGTAAIHTALAALNADPGGEIITCPVTDFGTVIGMLFQGLVPVFADWKPDTFNVDPADIERKITDRTRAILVVHIFGNPCDMDAVVDIARRHGLPVIEDCCQAYFTSYGGKWVGTIGDIGCFSMQQSKHLSAGDGGVVITNNEEYAIRMSLFTDKGWTNRGVWGARAYEYLGLNYRMNELTGAVALAQLGKLRRTVETMRRHGELLTSLIKDMPGIMPAPVTPGAEHSYWQYPIKVRGLDSGRFADALIAEGIPVWWGYTGKPIYLCTSALTEKKTFGNSGYPFNSQYYPAEIEYKEGLCPVAEGELPLMGVIRMEDTWSDSDVRDVATAIRKVAEGLSG